MGSLGARLLSPHPLLQVFQRRQDGSINFFRGWEAYRDGFGKLTGEHWLGEHPASGLPQCGLGRGLALSQEGG